MFHGSFLLRPIIIRPHKVVFRRCMMPRGRVLSDYSVKRGWFRTCVRPREDGTRSFGMSPRGEIAVPHGRITIAAARAVNAAAASMLRPEGTLVRKAYIRRAESTLSPGNPPSTHIQLTTEQTITCSFLDDQDQSRRQQQH